MKKTDDGIILSESLAEFGRSGDDGICSNRRSTKVETDVTLEGFFIGPVALETLVGKDGANVAIEVEFFLLRRESLKSVEDSLRQRGVEIVGNLDLTIQQP